MSEFPALCIASGCRPATEADPEPTPRRTNSRAWLCVVCVSRGRKDLERIADTWPDLEEALQRPEGSRDEQGRTKHGQVQVGLPLNERASEAKREASAHIWFMIRILDEHHADQGLTLPLPADRSIPGLCRWLADWRVEEFARMPGGDQLALEVFGDLANACRAVRSAAYPRGGRWVETGLPCESHATTDSGERVPCTGTMGAWVTPQMGHRPDLVCTLDDTHRITPDLWERAGWKRRHAVASG